MAKDELHVALENVSVKPFNVPKVVFRSKSLNGAGDDKGIPLSDLSPNALGILCHEFRSGVFEKAGKKDPQVPTIRTGTTR